MQERRRLLRVDAPLSLTCRTLAPPPWEAQTVSLDLSEGGLRFRTFIPLQAGFPLDVEMVLPFDSLPMRSRATVTWVRDDIADGAVQFEVGVRFDEMSASDRKRLVAYVRRHAPPR